jgi:hypothetical protein
MPVGLKILAIGGIHVYPALALHIVGIVILVVAHGVKYYAKGFIFTYLLAPAWVQASFQGTFRVGNAGRRFL